jgi:uncharacterized repeat protein (TIGR02543 family)
VDAQFSGKKDIGGACPFLPLFAVLFSVFLFALFFASCVKSEGRLGWRIRLPFRSFTVSFNTEGGSVVAAQTVNMGETAAWPDSPVRAGYVFDGWFTDGFANPYDFSVPLTGNIILYARWADLPPEMV